MLARAGHALGEPAGGVEVDHGAVVRGSGAVGLDQGAADTAGLLVIGEHRHRLVVGPPRGQ